MRRLVCAVAMAALALAGCSRSEASSDAPPRPSAESPAPALPSTEGRPDVIFVPTPMPVVRKMLQMAEVGKGDVLYDLGSGDGRIPITAARIYGIRAVGIDIDPERIAEAQANAREAGVEHLVTFRQANLFESDISEASVVTLYLLDSLNEQLRPKLLSELRPGTRIVSHAFRMGDWPPEEQTVLQGSSIYRWTVPEGETSAAR